MALSAVVFLSTKNSSATENTSLLKLASINDANAECWAHGNGDWRDSGHCYEYSDRCWWGGFPELPACDPWY